MTSIDDMLNEIVSIEIIDINSFSGMGYKLFLGYDKDKKLRGFKSHEDWIKFYQKLDRETKLLSWDRSTGVYEATDMNTWRVRIKIEHLGSFVIEGYHRYPDKKLWDRFEDIINSKNYLMEDTDWTTQWEDGTDLTYYYDELKEEDEEATK